MNTPVMVDWLTILLAPVVVVTLGLALYSRRKPARDGDRARLPMWGRVAQGVGIVSAMFLALIHVVWGG